MLEIEKLLPEKYFFIGDEAFTNTQQFLSLWPGKWWIYIKLIVCFFLVPNFNYLYNIRSWT